MILKGGNGWAKYDIHEEIKEVWAKKPISSNKSHYDGFEMKNSFGGSQRRHRAKVLGGGFSTKDMV